jgi:hypothetical protein
MKRERESRSLVGHVLQFDPALTAILLSVFLDSFFVTIYLKQQRLQEQRVKLLRLVLIFRLVIRRGKTHLDVRNLPALITKDCRTPIRKWTRRTT